MPPSIEQLKARAQAWLGPISSDKPGGQPARTDPSYEAVLAEIAKLESLTGSAVDWSLVADRAGGLLQTTTKDLLLACYLSSSLHATRSLDGLVTGMSLLAELMEQYWPVLYPEVTRMRGRVNALGWFLQRTTQVLSGARPQPADREAVEALVVATRRLTEVARAKFESQAPALTPLVQAVERMQQDLPAPAPVAPPSPATVLASAAATTGPHGASAAVTAPAGVTVSAPVPNAAGVTVEGMTDFLRQIGTALSTAATTLRRANPADAAAYRLSRMGLYLHLSQPPPQSAPGKTGVPALPANTRGQLERLASNGKWSEVLEESEGALAQHRFCLDLQHYSARALAGLGPPYAAARKVLVSGVAALLERFPNLPELACADGTGFADASTRAWLQEEVLAGGPPGPAASGKGARSGSGMVSAGPGSASVEAVVAEAKGLLKSGNAAEAIALLHGKVAAAGTAREKFALRLGLAKLCAEAGQVAVAKGMYAALEKECTARGIDDWEPNLAVECLEGLLSTARTLSKTSGTFPAELAPQYHRLCQLAPDVALRLGSS